MSLEYFTPATGLTGGALIGLSAAVLLIWAGDVLGCSGIVSSSFLFPKKSLTDPSVAWKMVFQSTFLLLSNLALAPLFTNDERLGVDPDIAVVSIYGYVIGGFFVGFGTRLGNGCTSGHGICGMARLSKRSIAAVVTFMCSGICTALIVAPDNNAFRNGTAWLRTDTAPDLYNRWLGLGVSMIVVLPTLYSIYNLCFAKKDETDPPKDVEASELTTGDDKSSPYGAFDNSGNTDGSNDSTDPPTVPCATDTPENPQDNRRKVFVAFVSASFFATGLAVSGMVLPSKISGFLNFLTIREGSYDPTLLTVMIGGCIVSMFSYQFVKPFSLIFSQDSTSPLALDRPLMVSKFSVPCNQDLDFHLIGGSFCFGIGWGLANLCPGPAMFLFASGTKPVIIGWWPAYVFGAIIAQWIKNKR